MNATINPGQPWLDTDGKRIEAHGGTMYIENGVFYWIGEDKSHTTQKGKIWTWGVRCYSSTDLYNWKDEGHIVKPEPDNRRSVLYPKRRLDRPHLLKNDRTGKYVLWLKFNDRTHFTILTADSLLGPYQIEKTVYRPFGCKCGDFDLAKDEKTGEAYLYMEADHKKILGVKLTEDYLDVQGAPVEIYKDLHPPLSREGPAHLLRGGKHYLLTSGMTGYVPNPSEVTVADSWLGKFRVLGDPHVADDSSASFNSQISHIFRYPGTDLYIAMADRWVPDFVMTRERYNNILRAVGSNYDRSLKCTMKERLALMQMPLMGGADTSKANYVWLPISFEGNMPRIEWFDSWRVEDFIPGESQPSHNMND